MKHLRAITSFGVVAVSVAVLAGCSGGGSPSSTESAAEYTLWDPYPQNDASSDWEARIQSCGEDAGVAIKRTSYDSQTLTNQALLAAQEGTLPDVLLYDNPGVSTLAATGALVDNSVTGLNAADTDANLLGPGVVDGKTYGVPIGSNTLALYYNKDILDAAGVDPAEIKDWGTLTDALAKVKVAGHNGITYAGFASEEGTFQFQPFFWGAGADLTQLDSPEAISALELWKGWLDAGYSTSAVITNTQGTSWEEFLAGDTAFGLNGTWQVNSAAEQPFDTGFIQVPGKDGGTAPTPTGGEFMLIPTQKDVSRYDVSTKIIECMSSVDGQVQTAVTMAYYIPPTEAGQEALLAENPDLEVWVDAVRNALGRTSELGQDYPKVSEQLWTAVGNALSGALTPEEALQQAQEDASAAING